VGSGECNGRSESELASAVERPDVEADRRTNSSAEPAAMATAAEIVVAAARENPRRLTITKPDTVSASELSPSKN
jgi:hypothetical protein